MVATQRAAMTLTLPSDREVVLTRTFNAPRALVFKAHTDPELIPRWWGPRGTTTVVDKLDLRPGGPWRFVHQMADGTEYAFRGEFREIVPPERLVYTFEFEPMPGHILIETVTFDEVDEKTTLTAHALFPSLEDRDGMIASGMETGAAEGYERLDELLAAM